jgi:glycosyltransferase involved in cell wall biosynthesis
MRAALRREMARFDLAHTHSVFLWPTWATARAARRAGVPYVVSPRGMLVRELIRRKSRWAKTAWIRLVETRNLEAAAAVHVTSRLEADRLREFGFDLPALWLVANGLDLPPAEGGTCPMALREVVTGPPYLLFLGRINWKKGLDRLIEALRRLPSIRLVVAGNDEEGYRRALESLAARHGVTQQVRFVGAVYGEEKQALLRHAGALVLPSYSENFGMVVLEAMAAGRPAIVTPETGAAEIVRESGAGIVLDGDPEALAAGIGALLREPERMQAMGQRGREAVASRYTWDAVAAAMESFYCSTRSRR